MYDKILSIVMILTISATLLYIVPDPVVTGSSVSADVGSPGVLACSVSNNPSGTNVTYQWKRDGNLLATSTMYQVSSSVNVFDAGVYTCKADVSASGGSPHAISGTGSVNVTFTVTSKSRYQLCTFCPLQVE